MRSYEMSKLDILPNVTDAQFRKNPDTNKDDIIKCKIDGKVTFVPISDANADYLKLMKLVSEKKLTIASS